MHVYIWGVGPEKKTLSCQKWDKIAECKQSVSRLADNGREQNNACWQTLWNIYVIQRNFESDSLLWSSVELCMHDISQLWLVKRIGNRHVSNTCVNKLSHNSL